MITFLRFINEVFLKGFQGNYGYSDVYQNPTPNELTQLGRPEHCGGPYGEPHLMQYGDKYYYSGGILNKDGLYAFNRNTSEHDQAKYQVPDLGTHWIPLYLHYFAGTNVMALSLSLFSLTGPARDQYNKAHANHDHQLLLQIAKHPAFRQYKHVVDFQDGSILK